ncbi:hypothetical protein [Saccharopolyspora pogona]|uniref:hypothetical protein n=1 Tax=Saccharopolyspora pogona TaxID=333966 RepID=UPI001689751F|nr:hypothetical protein [Saccharopolyspora pogona]
MIPRFCGDEFADLLAVDPADRTALAAGRASTVNTVYGKTGDHSELAASIASRIGELLLDARPPHGQPQQPLRLDHSQLRTTAPRRLAMNTTAIDRELIGVIFVVLA